MTVATMNDAASDHDLLDRWSAGDRAAGETLFARHYDAIYRFFANKSREPDELVQAAFINCIRAKEHFRRQSSFRTFLFAIARHRLLKHRERFARRGPMAEIVEEPIAAGAGPNTLLCERAEQRALLRALRRIPLDLQVLLELYYWEDLTSAELADILEIPHGTVRSRLRRGKQELREALARMEDAGELVETTADDFDRWVRSMRARRAGEATPR